MSSKNDKPKINIKNLDNTSDNKPKRDKRGRLLPGHTANPNGKPTGSISLIALLKKELENIPKHCKTNKEKRNYAQLLIRKVLDQALAGDQQLIKMVFAYIEGQPKQSIAHEGGIDSTVKVVTKKTPKEKQLEEIIDTLHRIGVVDVFKRTPGDN